MPFRLNQVIAVAIALLLAGPASHPAFAQGRADVDAAASADTANRHLAQWQRLGYGMFIHWGLYSELGGVWKGAPVREGYSEQIQSWAKIPHSDYAQVATRFRAGKFDPDAICALAKDAGARYIVVTSKHHDGFVMFKTASTDFNVVARTPFKRDPLKLLSDACRRQGLGFGVYFSLVDWHAGHRFDGNNNNPVPASMEPLIEQQLRELMTGYGPLVEVWFDMSTLTPEQSRRFAGIVRSLQPRAAINGRIWNNAGDFVTLGDNQAPPVGMQPPFEVPASIYHSTWGYRSWQERKDRPEKVRELAFGLVGARVAGGGYLLNIGPDGDGAVVPFEADVLRGIGGWLKRHSDVPLDISPSGLPAQPWGVTGRQGDALYLFVRDWRAGELRVAGFASRPSEVRIHGVNDDTALTWRQDGNDLLIALPPRIPDEVLPVVRVAVSDGLRIQPAGTVAIAASGITPIPADRWQTGGSYAYGDSYSTQRSTQVLLTAYLRSAQATRIGLRMPGVRVNAEHDYRVSVAGHSYVVPGKSLATRTIGPFALPANEAVALSIRIAKPDYVAEDLGLHFSADVQVLQCSPDRVTDADRGC
ncbi:alpha-L-fucosidase [Lysobacter sp. CA199]|uniref:alpha-L-fucosidase n=1 Tax=Lysobacter sp. CA199 TaxID=3455608 RepID=UPI003F8D0CCF